MRTILPYALPMRREELIRKIKALGKVHGVYIEWDEKRGKGSHGTMYYGSQKATIPGGELKKKTLHSILRQLKIDIEEV